MAIESKNHRPSPVDRVLVSQGTRRDAQPVEHLRFETYSEERDHYIAKKNRISNDLRSYNKGAYSIEQGRVRRENINKGKSVSVAMWFARKAVMDAARLKLTTELSDMEGELLRLRPLVYAEKQREQDARQIAPQSHVRLEDFGLFREDESLSWDGVAAQLLIELRSIRELLTVLVDREGGEADSS